MQWVQVGEPEVQRQRTMDVLVEKVGVPRITPKGLRHTAQSVGRIVVHDDKVMQERLGHADIGITLRTYTHLVTEQHRVAPASASTKSFRARRHEARTASQRRATG